MFCVPCAAGRREGVPRSLQDDVLVLLAHVRREREGRQDDRPQVPPLRVRVVEQGAEFGARDPEPRDRATHRLHVDAAEVVPVRRPLRDLACQLDQRGDDDVVTRELRSYSGSLVAIDRGLLRHTRWQVSHVRGRRRLCERIRGGIGELWHRRADVLRLARPQAEPQQGPDQHYK